MKSWKTSLCGLLGALFLGLSQIPELAPLWIKIFALLGGLMPTVGLLFARDNLVTSEQAGAAPKTTLPLLALLLAPALLFVGCRSLDPAGPYHGAKLAYDADTAIVTGYDVLHEFVKWEADNRPALARVPAIKLAADHVRTHAPEWIATAIAAREAYSRTPTADTRDQLTRALAVLRAGLVEAVKYLNQPTP